MRCEVHDPTFLCCIVRIGAEPGRALRAGGERVSGPMNDKVAAEDVEIRGLGFDFLEFKTLRL